MYELELFLLVREGIAEVLAIDESNLDSLSMFDLGLLLFKLSGGIFGCYLGSSFLFSSFAGDFAGTGTTFIDLLFADDIELLLSGDTSFFEGETT